MAHSDSDDNFRNFANTLTEVIKTQQKIDGLLTEAQLLEKQCKQFQELTRLEKEFRDAMGDDVYEAFIAKICDENGNILTSRPYFRERQEICIGPISQALKRRDVVGLLGYNINYNFISFALKLKHWPKAMVDLGKRIEKARRDIIVMNMPLAISQSRIFWGKAPAKTQDSRFTFMDFVQVAADGLMSAVDKFVLPPDLDNNPAAIRVWRAVAIGRIKGNAIEMFCLDRDTILIPYGQKPKKIVDFVKGDEIECVNQHGQPEITQVSALHDHGEVEGFEVEFSDGYKIVCSSAHKFLTEQGMLSLRDIVALGSGVLCNGSSAQREWLDGTLRNDLGNSKGNKVTHGGVPEVSGDAVECEGRSGSCGAGVSCLTSGRLADTLRIELPDPASESLPPQGLPNVSCCCNSSGCSCDEAMEGEESRSCGCKYDTCQGSVSGPDASGSTAGQVVEGNEGCGAQELAEGTPGADVRKHEEGLDGSEIIKDGSLAEVQRDFGVGRRADTLWGGSKAGRLRVPGSQDLGGGGRSVPLQGGRQEPCASLTNDPDSGCNAKRRGIETPGCDIDQASYDLLLLGDGDAETGLATMAYSDAPLSSTGSLVLRRVVRVRAVGPRHMYDLEVSHPKHNYLLPNGVVTSNSETTIHFFPQDKRKLYRANKHMKDYSGRVDFDTLSAKVNSDLGPDGPKTNSAELANLMGAAANTIQSGTDEEEDPTDTPLTRAAATSDWQPDTRAEKSETMETLSQGLRSLSLYEQKLIKMQGIGTDLL